MVKIASSSGVSLKVSKNLSTNIRCGTSFIEDNSSVIRAVANTQSMSGTGVLWQLSPWDHSICGATSQHHQQSNRMFVASVGNYGIGTRRQPANISVSHVTSNQSL